MLSNKVMMSPLNSTAVSLSARNRSVANRVHFSIALTLDYQGIVIKPPRTIVAPGKKSKT